VTFRSYEEHIVLFIKPYFAKNAIFAKYLLIREAKMEENCHLFKRAKFGNHHLPFFVPRVSEFEKCNVPTQRCYCESTQNTEPFR
jgi:hypothetical protein